MLFYICTYRDLIFRRVEVSTLRHLSGQLKLPASTVTTVNVMDNEYVPELPSTPTGTDKDRTGTVASTTTSEPVKLTKTRCDIHDVP